MNILWESQLSQTKLPPYYEACENILKAGVDELHRDNKVMSYLVSRGLSSRTIKEFGVGARDGKVLFPIYTPWEDRLIVGGFQTRTIDGDGPKYKNVDNNMYFKKSYSLFGVNVALPHIEANNLVYVVEGTFDAMIMSQCGYPHVVSVMGSHISDVQAMFLREMNANVCVIFDGDKSGANGMADACITLMSVGIEKPMGVLLPDGEDPASFLIKNGTMRFARHVPLIEHWFENRKNGWSIAGRYEFIKELVCAYDAHPCDKGFEEMIWRVMYEVRPL